MPHTRQSGTPSPAQGQKSEEGFILLMVILMAVLLLIALAIAAPRIAVSIQRDKEIEAVHRGEQYKHAIKLYYVKFGSYPTSIDQLLNTDNIRFLRKRYKDPITGKDDWRLIYLGQAKVPPLGFFGEPLTGLNGPAGIGTPITGTAGAAGTTATGTSAAGSSTFGSATDSSSFGSSSFGSSSDVGSSGFGDSSFGSSSSFGSPSTDTNTATPSATGTAASSTGAENSATSSSSSTTGKDAAGFAIDNSNPTGGGPIVGVGIPVDKPSLLAYKKQTHYNQWEFVYNPIEDQMRAAAAALNGGIQTQSGTSSNDDNGFGGLTGSSGSNNNNGFGNSGNDTFGTNSSAFGSGSGSNSSNGSTNSNSGSNQNQSNQDQNSGPQ